MKRHRISLFSKNNNRIYSFLEIKEEAVKQTYAYTSSKQVVRLKFPIHHSLLCDHVMSAYFPTCHGDSRALFVCTMKVESE